MPHPQTELFEKKSIYRAVLRLAVPSVAGQIILVIYNMADTFFVGLTKSDVNITAVTISMPAFMILSAIANLFGVGGGAAFSRALGRRDGVRCGNVAAHALFGCLFTAAAYSAAVWIFRDAVVDMLGGGNALVHAEASGYISVTVCAGGILTAVQSLFAHLVRAEGRSALSSAGTVLGGVLNILLDPLFMFVLFPKGSKVLGAAAATAVSNLVSCAYFIILLSVGKTSLRFSFSRSAFKDDSLAEVLKTGLPACLMTLLENISYAVLGALMAFWGISAQAGIGVAKKVNMLAHSAVRGIAQGALPLIAYNYSSENYARMKKAFGIAACASAALSAVLTVIYLLFSRELTGLFISGGDSRELGAAFLRILCIGCPFSAFAYTVISFFQAVGDGMKSFALAVLRKGAVDIPLMFIMKDLFDARGIVFATPAADMACCAAAAALAVYWFYRLKKSGLPPSEGEVEEIC